MANPDQTDARRILVALDTSPFGLEALEAASELAAELQTKLLAIFVEDINLVRMAGLPFTREITYSSAAGRQLDLTRTECALRADAERIRRVLAARCHQVRIEWSLNVTRGHVTRTPLEAAGESDVLIIGREGTTSRISADRRTQDRPVLVFYDDSESSRRGLQTAARLSRSGAPEIVVLLAHPNAQQRQEMRLTCASFLESQGVTGIYRHQVESDAESLIRSAWQSGARLLVIPRDCPLFDEGSLETLVDRLDCPIGLVG